MASLRDVAERAGVSVATASRVASGAGRVRPATRERVERAMRDLLYVPPGRPPATGLIGVLVPELANPIFPALAQAIETRAAPHGLASILCNTESAAMRESDYVHMLLDRGVEGMIFVSCQMTNLDGRPHALPAPDRGGRAPRLRQRRARLARRALGRGRRGGRGRAGDALPGRAGPPPGRLRRRAAPLPADAAEGDRPRAGAPRPRARAGRARRTRRLRDRGGRGRPGGAARAGRAAQRRRLLERHDGDRRPARGGAARALDPARPFRGRLRRDRRGLDAAGADDDRAADRGDRRDGALGAARPDRQPRSGRCRTSSSGRSCGSARRPGRGRSRSSPQRPPRPARRSPAPFAE